MGPVWFVVQMSSKVLVGGTLDAQHCRWRVSPSEVHLQLFGFPRVDLEVVLQAPVYKALHRCSVLLNISVSDEADDRSLSVLHVIDRKFLMMQ